MSIPKKPAGGHALPGMTGSKSSGTSVELRSYKDWEDRYSNWPKYLTDNITILQSAIDKFITEMQAIPEKTPESTKPDLGNLRDISRNLALLANKSKTRISDCQQVMSISEKVVENSIKNFTDPQKKKLMDDFHSIQELGPTFIKLNEEIVKASAGAQELLELAPLAKVEKTVVQKGPSVTDELQQKLARRASAMAAPTAVKPDEKKEQAEPRRTSMINPLTGRKIPPPLPEKGPPPRPPRKS